VSKATPVLLGAFAAVATLILLATGAALVWPGTALDALWSLTPNKRATLEPYRLAVGIGFLVLSIPAAMLSYGAFGHRAWARPAAIVALAINGAGDASQALFGRWLEAGVGATVALALILWLSRPSVAAAFDKRGIS
jgi:DMSO reductase anchor subunit